MLEQRYLLPANGRQLRSDPLGPVQAGRRPLISRPERALTTFLRDASGITLIELLMCSFIVGIGAVALGLMFARGQANIAGEGDNRTAVYLAQQKAEVARAQGFASLTAGTTCDGFDQNLVSVACGSAAFYTRTTVVDCVDASDYSSPVDCTTANAARRVTVTVNASPKEARQATDPLPVRLTAVLANR
jgi:hypothetical protein